MGQRALLLLTVAVLGSVTTGAALAQDQGRRGAENRSNAAKITTEDNPGEDVSGAQDDTRVDDSFQPQGVELGQFLLFPRFELAQEYNSNVFASENDVRDDFATRATAEARLRSRFRQHALNAALQLEQLSYWKYTDDSHFDPQAWVDGRFDFSKEWEANGFLNVYKRVEDRGSPDDVNGDEPTPVYGAESRLGTRLTQGRFTYGLTGELGRKIFWDVETSGGTEVNNSDRDRWEMQLTGRGEYEMFPGYSAVAQLSANRREYDSEVDDAGFARSSQGIRAFTGVGVNITQLIRGDFLLGYMRQDYEDDRLSDPSGPALKASFNWSPSKLTLIVPALERSVLETTTTNASSIVSSRASVLVRHELQRNVVLTGFTSATFDEFEGTSRQDTTYEARARFIWALAPEYYVGGELGHRRRESDADGSSYDQTVLALRFGLRM